MPLTDDLRQLAHGSLAALDASHDYYTHTLASWELVRKVVANGQKFTIQSKTTQTDVDQAALLNLLPEYTVRYLRSFSFQHFVSLFESFLFDLLRLWLAAHPRSLSSRQFTLGALLDAPDKDTVILAAIDKELNDLKYQRAADWFTYLEKLARLGCPTSDEIERIAEIKASRDILVHNQGIANAVYVAKSGSRARFQAGELLEIPEPYHRDCWQMLRKVMSDLAGAAAAKA